jgi:Na+-driven multidrug efflux pump
VLHGLRVNTYLADCAKTRLRSFHHISVQRKSFGGSAVKEVVSVSSDSVSPLLSLVCVLAGLIATGVGTAMVPFAAYGIVWSVSQVSMMLGFGLMVLMLGRRLNQPMAD